MSHLDLPYPIRWENHTTTRYYEATLQENLFGDLELLLVWGRIGSRRGGHQCKPLVDRAAGAAEVATLAKMRTRRGYGFASALSR